MPPEGYLTLVLHCHLPFVRHPECEEFLEEDWLFEAVAESYLPLLEAFERLREEGVDFSLTLCVSPTLCEMLADGLLQDRCARYVARRVELMEKEARARRGTPLEGAAQMYLRRYRGIQKRCGERPGETLLGGLRRLQDEGYLELITTAATHALLPLLRSRRVRRAQIEQGCRSYRDHFGRRPRGMWLPECAYREGLEGELAASGLEFFFLETHGLLLARPRPVHGIFAPVVSPAGPAAFGRDPESSAQVWSQEEGYPGDPIYREFYRDLGFDAGYDYIRPYLNPAGFRHYLGIKYHRISGGDVPPEQKKPYRPGPALRRAEEHADHFLTERRRQARQVARGIGRPPVIVSPYDAELFGHWWFEGPHFLECVLRGLGGEEGGLRTATPTRYLEENPRQQVCRPATSSWGYEGYFEVWVNGATDWIWRHLEEAGDRMERLAGRWPDARGLRRRALNQCARELMLAQSSDWPFLISCHSAEDYARRRVRGHLARFGDLCHRLEDDCIDEELLARLEGRDNLFEGMDYGLFAPGSGDDGPD